MTVTFPLLFNVIPATAKSFHHRTSNFTSSSFPSLLRPRFSSPTMTNILQLRDTAAGESRLESLPPDILVEILCRLPHRDLDAAACASHKLRAAVEMTYKVHFDFNTPDRLRKGSDSPANPGAPCVRNKSGFESRFQDKIPPVILDFSIF